MSRPGGQLRARADLDDHIARLHTEIATLSQRIDVAIDS
jgi:hypothetical protein